MGSILPGIFNLGKFTTSNEVSQERALTPQDVSVDSHEYPKHLMLYS